VLTLFLLLLIPNAMQVFAILATVSQQLRPVLSYIVYLRVMGRLMNIAAGRIISEIVALNDIGVQETLQVVPLRIRFDWMYFEKR
jgi:hypothetical protein